MKGVWGGRELHIVVEGSLGRKGAAWGGWEHGAKGRIHPWGGRLVREPEGAWGGWEFRVGPTDRRGFQPALCVCM